MLQLQRRVTVFFVHCVQIGLDTYLLTNFYDSLQLQALYGPTHVVAYR